MKVRSSPVVTASPALPVASIAPSLALAVVLQHGLHPSFRAWLGFAYVSVISMFLGLFAWYRGPELGGIARVGQIQLVQSVLTMTWAALFLGEVIDLPTALAGVLVIASVALTRLSWRPGSASQGRSFSFTAWSNQGAGYRDSRQSERQV